MKRLKIGDIVKQRNRFYSGLPEGALLPGFKTIFSVGDRPSGSAMAYDSGKDGKPTNTNEVQCFHTFDFESLKKVGHISLSVITVKIEGVDYTYTRTSNKSLNVWNSHYDGRATIFRKYAPKRMQNKFDNLENDNYHGSCASLIDDFYKNIKTNCPDLKVSRIKIVKS